MLDQFIYGYCARISPEAPIPVLKITRETQMLGGAGNVLANLAGLGANGHLFAVIGDDRNGQVITEKVKAMGLKADGLMVIDDRPTTVKSRFIAQNQQLLRTDDENDTSVSENICQRLLDSLFDIISDYKALILSDYGKGLLQPFLIEAIIQKARQLGIPVIVDPKSKDFSLYKGASIITPNKKELSDACGGQDVQSDQALEKAATRIIAQTGIEAVIATRSEQGISVVQKSATPVHISTKVQEIVDVSGAGDTVVAVIAAAIAAGSDIQTAARLANYAGGVVVGKPGTATIQAADFYESGQVRIENKFLDRNKAEKTIQQWKAQGLKVGFTNGHFDILHTGHVQYLQAARNRCDRLVIGMNSDGSTTRRKGPNRPINPEPARAHLLSALSCVDLVVVFGDGEDEDMPIRLIEHLRPDIIVKGGDYTIDQLPEAKVVQAYGGQVEIMGMVEGYSTTAIEKKLNEAPD